MANLQCGAENISGVKVFCSFLCCASKKKNLYIVFWDPPISYLLHNRSKGEKDWASPQNTFGNSLSISISCFIKLQQKKKCFSQMVLTGCQLSKCICWKTPFIKRPYFAKDVIFGVCVLLAIFFFLPFNYWEFRLWNFIVLCLNIKLFLCVCVHMHWYVYMCTLDYMS